MNESETPRPADFDTYWDAVDQELARYPAAPTLERLALPSDELSTVYAVRITSSGPYRIFGYLSVPPGAGPFPGLLVAPHYGSVNHLPHLDDRRRYVAPSFCSRCRRLTPAGWRSTATTSR
jgi:cephalosporin-C deacetylase-like acetyl esterase